MTDEDTCKQCGLCCRKIEIVRGDVYFTGKYCIYFDRDTKLCKVYDRRFSMCSACNYIGVAIGLGFAPESCAYAPEGYKCIVKEKRKGPIA